MQATTVSQPQWILTAIGLLLPLSLQAQSSERYALSGEEVAIYNLAGEIVMEQGPGPDVAVQVTRGGADAAKLKVARGELDNGESLRLLYPADLIRYARLTEGSSIQLRVRVNGTFGDENGRDGEGGRQVTITGRRGGGLDAYADLRVTVPPGKRVDLHLAAGKVSVSNVSGDLRIEVSSASVTTSNTRGELEIEVGSGAVQVTQSRGDLSVKTGSGDVGISDMRGESVSLDAGSGMVTASNLRAGQLSIEAGSGDIGASGLTVPKVSLKTGSGSITAELSGDLWNVSVETGSGDVTLRAPPTLDAEVDIETASGEIETDFEVAVTRHARDHLTGRIGDGAGKLAIETGSGAIKLLKIGPASGT